MKSPFHVVSCILILVSLVAAKGKGRGRSDGDKIKTNNGKRNGHGPVRAQRCKKNKNKNRCAFPTADLGLDDRDVDEIELDMKGDGKTIVCRRRDDSSNGLSWYVNGRLKFIVSLPR